jgi:hypothetical protein
LHCNLHELLQSLFLSTLLDILKNTLLAHFLEKKQKTYSEFLGGVPVPVRVGQPDKSVRVSFTSIDDDHRS